MLFGSSSIVNTSRLVNFLARNTTSNLGTTASSARNHFLSPRHALLFSSTMASATSGSDPQYFTGASGCFWGPDALYRKHFTGKGLIDAQVGYIGGNPDINNPSYEDVCTGKTGHAEAIQVKFDPSQVSYAELVEFLYRTHDPTTKDRQGADRGTQYRSAIFPHNDEQLAIVKKVTEEVQAKHFTPKGKQIVTSIEPLPVEAFNKAEPYHQEYLAANPSGYHCPMHKFWW